MILVKMKINLITKINKFKYNKIYNINLIIIYK